jgi:hypothetical protein
LLALVLDARKKPAGGASAQAPTPRDFCQEAWQADCRVANSPLHEALSAYCGYIASVSTVSDTIATLFQPFVIARAAAVA